MDESSSRCPPVNARHRVTIPVPIDPSGSRGPTKRQAASDDWRRTSRGFYVPSHVEPSPLQRVAEVAVLLRSDRIAVTGWAALAWRGDPWASGRRADGSLTPVDLTSTHALLKPQPAFRLSQERADPREFEVVDGLRVTTAPAAVCFAVRHATSLDAAVEVLDMAYLADLVTPEEVGEWAQAHPWQRRRPRVAAALELADENAWSPQEVHLRLAWLRATGRRPLTNRPVFDSSGRRVATPDLLDPMTGVAGEYDGDVHLTRAGRRRDLGREQALRAVGLEPFTVVAGDLRDGRFEERLRVAEGRAARVASADRHWTVEPPDWWVPTTTVAERRALAPHERRIWLRRG